MNEAWYHTNCDWIFGWNISFSRFSLYSSSKTNFLCAACDIFPFVFAYCYLCTIILEMCILPSITPATGFITNGALSVLWGKNRIMHNICIDKIGN